MGMCKQAQAPQTVHMKQPSENEEQEPTWSERFEQLRQDWPSLWMIQLVRNPTLR